MKVLITFFLLLFPLAGFSQTETTIGKGWKVGLMFSQDFYRSAYIPSGPNNGYDLEPADFNYTAGLSGQFNIKPGLEFLTGINYSQKDFTSTVNCPACRFLVPPKPMSLTYEYLEVPALLSYSILHKRIGLNAEAGFLGGYSLNDLENENDKILFGSRYLLSGQAGVGLSYTILQDIDITLKGIYRRTIDDFAKETDADKLSSVAIATGITYTFK